LQWTSTTEQVNLSWTEPCNSVSGYNIFRSDSTGNPPFIKINATPVIGSAFTDVPPGWSSDDIYRYYVTALQTDIMTGLLLCESGASDTVLVAFPTGIPEHGTGLIRIYPNPAGNYVIICSEIPVKQVHVISNFGKVLYTGNYDDAEQLRLNTAEFSQGIYFVQLLTDSGILFRKFAVSR
jgi:hypothetical protein